MPLLTTVVNPQAHPLSLSRTLGTIPKLTLSKKTQAVAVHQALVMKEVTMQLIRLMEILRLLDQRRRNKHSLKAPSSFSVLWFQVLSSWLGPSLGLSCWLDIAEASRTPNDLSEVKGRIWNSASTRKTLRRTEASLQKLGYSQWGKSKGSMSLKRCRVWSWWWGMESS